MTTDTTPPESIHEALIEAVRATGGSKAVAAALWPAKAARNLEDARRYLAACLDPERAEKLALEEIMLIARMARERGCHVLMAYLAADLGYQAPVPMQPADEADELRRRFIAATEDLARMAERIQRIEARPVPRAVA